MTAKQRNQRTENVLYAFDRYCKDSGKNLEITDVIAEGGCAIIYNVRNKKTGETVVLKAVDTAVAEIDCSIADLDKYTREEIKILKACKGHKNIIKLLDAYSCPIDAGTGETVYFMFLPRLEPVISYFKKNANDKKDILAMTSDICNALTFCHQNGILHRDVKHNNIYYSYENKCFVLADFGVSRTAFDPTRAVTVVGTYIAPEIAARLPLCDKFGNKRYNSDIFSLGITTLLLLAAFNASGSPYEYLEKMKPEELRVIIAKAIAADPDLRYQTADEFAKDIKKIFWGKKAAAQSTDAAKCSELLVRGQPKKAKVLAEEGHKNGNVKMSCILAYILCCEGKVNEALDILSKLKSTGDRVVLGVYGMIGCTFAGASGEYKKSILASADKGFCLAEYYIGRWISDGQNGFDEDFFRGFDYIYRSAKQGFLPSVRYMQKALKRRKVHNSDAMIDLLCAELDGYNHDKDFPVHCVQAIAMG